MKKTGIKQNVSLKNSADDHGEQGTAIVIALFVLALVSVFVALAISRSTAEAAATGNETAEARTFYAAQGSLETMTRNFNKVFEVKLNPTTGDLNNVRNGTVAGLGNYTFLQELEQLTDEQGRTSTVTTLGGGPFTGLISIQDNWRLRTTATDHNGNTVNPAYAQVQLTRSVLNNRIPIFQFGIFYNDDLELFRPPRFSFGGRVHSNGNFFVSPGTEGVYFDSRVTAADQIITQTWRNWNQGDSGNSQTWIKNASGTFVQLTPDKGSVLNTTFGAADNIFQFPPAVPVPAQTPNLDLPPSRLNTSFLAQSSIFDGNLQSQVPLLKLPLNVGANTDLVEMVKRGKEIASATGGDLWNNAGVLSPVTAANTDNGILRSERFTNKSGIRVTLADSKAKLPGCASGAGTAAIAAPCGVRLDGRIDGSATEPNVAPTPTPTPERVRGYQPLPMKRVAADATFLYRTTRVNGERFYTGGNREVWIKVETVQTNTATGAIVTSDITADFLSLGVTEPPVEIRDSGNVVKFKITDTSIPVYDGSIAPTTLTATTPQTPASNGTDSRSIIKIQRFVVPGTQIPVTAPTPYTSYFAVAGNPVGNPGFNVVQRFPTAAQAAGVPLDCNGGCGTQTNADAGLETFNALDAVYKEDRAHLKLANVNGVTTRAIVPFPIEMFDAREGYYYDERSANIDTNFASQLPRNGVMSMIDIDVANLRRFLRGDFNGLFPINTTFAVANGGVGLTNANIPQEAGWVFYVSDRRGDADFDGEYDMEDIYGNLLGPNNGSNELGEDVNKSGGRR